MEESGFKFTNAQGSDYIRVPMLSNPLFVIRYSDSEQQGQTITKGT